MTDKNLIIIGNGMVCDKLCKKLIDKNSNLRITVFGEEKIRAYDRVHLTDYLKLKTQEELFLTESDWYSENSIVLHLADPIIDINRLNKTVTSKKGHVSPYDYLVFATGSEAFVPHIKGIDKKGVFIYRTLEDLDLIRNYVTNARKGTVLGGGLLGLEAAKALHDLGIKESTVIEFAPRLMPRQIDEMASGVLQHQLRALGLQCLLQKSTTEIHGKESITGISFSDNSSIQTDILVISAGIKPRDELAKKIGLQTGQRGGIVVDSAMKTTDPSIYAIGECALFQDMIYGLVAPGYEMAEVVASG